jgi:hypothetical protein
MVVGDRLRSKKWFCKFIRELGVDVHSMLAWMLRCGSKGNFFYPAFRVGCRIAG